MQQLIKISLLILCLVFAQASIFASTPATADMTTTLKNPTKSKRAFATLQEKLQSVKDILLGDEKPEETGKISRSAIMGFLCGVASFLMSEIVFAVILALLAVILSGVSIGTIRSSAGKIKGKFLAILGLILGIIATLLSLIYLVSI